MCLVGVDQQVWGGFGETVEVLPGLHSFIFEPRTARGVQGERVTLRVFAQPGHVYQTVTEIAKTGRPVIGQYTVRIRLEDITEKAALDPTKRIVRSR